MKLLIEDIRLVCNVDCFGYNLEDMIGGYRERFPVCNKWMIDHFGNVGIAHGDPIPEFKVYQQTGISGDDEIVILHDNVNMIVRTLAFSMSRLKNEIKNYRYKKHTSG